MSISNIRLLSIVPYKVIPANNGGRVCIVKTHHYLAQRCTDHIVTTENNEENTYAFEMHKIFPDKTYRYLPGYAKKKMLDIAKENKCTHIICEHPYMALTAISLSKRLNIPWYMHSHNIESERFRTLGKKWWPILKQYEQYAMKRSNGIFFLTQEDADWAVNKFGISKDKCHVTPFGTDLIEAPQIAANRKEHLGKEFGLDSSIPWMYFLGQLDYKPNADAVGYILNEIKPRLDKQNIKCEILIGGKGLNDEMAASIKATNNMHYLGFVPDLHEFINVLTGGGIKTKAVEALAYNKILISSASGAAGLRPEVCGDNLIISNDYDWDAFTHKIKEATHMQASIPQSFYKEYYWGNIAEKLLSILNK
jgi:glycosyltransferase involved in cell wall biosynthesis